QRILKGQRRTDSELIVTKCKRFQRAGILPVQIVKADIPEPGDVRVDGELKVIIIIGAVDVNGVRGAEVHSIFEAGAEADEDALKETLLQSKVNISVAKVGPGDNGGVLGAARAFERDTCAIEWFIAHTQIEYRREVGAASIA